MTPSDFRRIALSFPGAEESSHMAAADFRVGGRIFATLASVKEGFGNLMLTPEQQALFLADAPDIFLPIKGGWGRNGATHIRLAVADEPTLTGALSTAYKLRLQKNAPATRRKTQMTKILLTFALLTPAVLAPRTFAQQTLSTLVGRDRVLLVFAPSALDRRFGQQLDAFDHHEVDLTSRDLVLIPLLQQPDPASPSTVLRNLRPPLVHADEQITVRRRFHVGPSDFAVILLGKTGAETLRSTTPIPIARLTRSLDAMAHTKN